MNKTAKKPLSLKIWLKIQKSTKVLSTIPSSLWWERFLIWQALIRQETWPHLQISSDPSHLWGYLKQIGAVTRPTPSTGNETQREHTVTSIFGSRRRRCCRSCIWSNCCCRRRWFGCEVSGCRGNTGSGCHGNAGCGCRVRCRGWRSAVSDWLVLLRVWTSDV